MSREDLRCKPGTACARGNLPQRRSRNWSRRKSSKLQGELVKRAGSTITLEPEEARAKEQIEAAFAGAGLAVPP